MTDQGTVDIQRRNINSKDHKKKKFDLKFYIKLWCELPTRFVIRYRCSVCILVRLFTEHLCLHNSHCGRHKNLTEFAAAERGRNASVAAAAEAGTAAATAAATVGSDTPVPILPPCGAAAPSPVAALVTAQVTGSAPPVVATVTPQAFELARRSLTEAVAPSVADAAAPAPVSLVPSEETGADESAPEMAAKEGKNTTPAVVSSPCSPSSPPGVETSGADTSAKSDESVLDASAASLSVRDAEGFLIDENYTKQQLQDAVVEAAAQ